jgi:hypothetical protein
MANCPSGFEPGPQSTCHVQCPAAFQYTQEGGEACILRTDATKRVSLTALPFNATDAQHQAERTRVQEKVTAIETEIQGRRDLVAAQTAPVEWAQAYDQVQKRYADYTGASAAIDETIKTLRGRSRPPVAPAEDLSLDRRWLLSGQYEEPDVRFFQIALILLVLSMVGYFVLPLPVAHLVTTVLLGVGAAVGFFLRS